MPFKAEGLMAELFLRTHGGFAGHEELLPTIGTTRIEVLRNNPERSSIVFVNVGADFIHVTPSRRIASGSGIALGPNGGFISVILPEDAPLPSMPWFAVADSAGNDLYILTTVRVAKVPQEVV